MQLYLLSARCKDGYFGLSADDALGCTRCFCYGHSSNCTASGDYVLDVIQSDFTTGACCASFVTTVHDSYVINNIVTTMIWCRFGELITGSTWMRHTSARINGEEIKNAI